MPTFTIRPATVNDAAQVERLYQQSAEFLRRLGDESDHLFNAEIYLRDGFGPAPAFAGVVAQGDDALIGYLLYTFGYDTDRALRYLFVIDLLVDEAQRGQGVGTALMKRAAEIARAAGAQELSWAVYKANERAFQFYRRLGAEEVTDLKFMTLKVGE